MWAVCADVHVLKTPVIQVHTSYFNVCAGITKHTCTKTELLNLCETITGPCSFITMPRFSAGFCVALAACSAFGQPLPAWTALDLNPFVPLGGATLAANVAYSTIYRATLAVGTFNSNPMIDYHDGQLLVSWPMNNGTSNGFVTTTILYSQTMDGGNWTETDGTNILFPAITTSTSTEHLTAAPALHVNGSVYAAATVGSQFYLYPDQQMSNLLLRRVYLPGMHQFGPIFWATNSPPPGFENISAQLNISTLNQMDEWTQSDIATLADYGVLPCDSTATGSWQCPVCLNGCPTWVHPYVSGEASIYHVSPEGPDVVFNRDGNRTYKLPASLRNSSTDPWAAQVYTNIPDSESDFDAGNFPDGRPFLLSNAMPDVIRDPLFLTTSGDGWNFNSTTALTSCTLAMYTSADQPLGCLSRYNIESKEFGCQSPQAVVLTAPGFEGFWATYSLNNEDIWVIRVPFASVP
jgi:hypothetical protein